MKTKNLLLSLAVGVSLQANAIDIFDHESIPSYYATVEKVVNEEDNTETYNVTFKTDAIAWRPSGLNRVLSGYGLQLEPLAAENLPSSYASVVEVEPSEVEMLAEAGTETVVQHEVEFEINYGSGAIAWRPPALHNILSSYNLVPNFDVDEDGSPVASFPSDYGEVVMAETTVTNEQTGEQELVLEPKLKLKSSAILWRPTAIHQILQGYKQGPDLQAQEELAAQ